MESVLWNSVSPSRVALLGHTGFVGSNLLNRMAGCSCYNSTNVGSLAGQEFDLVVCAAVSAVKWQANRDPEGDWRGIQSLLDALGSLRASRFILISTVDVYRDPRGVDEDVDPTLLSNHAYGTHRLRVEKFVVDRFPVTHVVRLPGLFGPGLKKNVIFDLIHDRALDGINPDSAFQYYDLTRLADDLDRVVSRDIRLLNLATEPVRTGEMVSRFFPERVVGRQPSPPVLYDFRSKHAALWGSVSGYLYSAETVLEDLARFLATGSQRIS